jgi:hypothetical protein
MKKKKLLSFLKFWLQPKEVLLKNLQPNILGQNKTRRIFIDRDSDILLMAHIDTVKVPQLKKHKGNTIWASGLDDRLGCVLSSILSADLNTDLLITDFEEAAESTGQYHELKDYNWIAEFDRNGDDVVTYDLDCDEFLVALKEHFKIGCGAFSDLCFLNTQSCCVNVGIGYKYDHSEDSYVDLAVMNSQIAKFRKFFHQYKNQKFVQDGRASYYNYNPYKDYWDQYQDECDFCGNLGGKEVFGVRICECCFDSMSTEYLYTDWEHKNVNR